MTHEDARRSRASKWGKRDLQLRGKWQTARLPIQEHFPSERNWEGVPCDEAWQLEHVYGFPGEVLPQAYKVDDEFFSEDLNLVFSVGDRCFCLIAGDVGRGPQIFSWPLDASDYTIPPAAPGLYALQHPTRATARTVKFAFGWFFQREANAHLFEADDSDLAITRNRNRNRWDEMRERSHQY
uniref:Uncharacterized protein n=1 Tax=Mycena chlorophos TaxID=658473 RepID=A0ABQ0M1T3_MYCCL|nr:predicted protein [Mycena chlorophos]